MSAERVLRTRHQPPRRNSGPLAGQAPLGCPCTDECPGANASADPNRVQSPLSRRKSELGKRDDGGHSRRATPRRHPSPRALDPSSSTIGISESPTSSLAIESATTRLEMHTQSAPRAMNRGSTAGPGSRDGSTLTLESYRFPSRSDAKVSPVYLGARLT